MSNETVKIPIEIIKHLTGLLNALELDCKSELDSDIEIYLQGKIFQNNLRKEFTPENELIKNKYSQNKKLIEELEIKIISSLV